MSALGGARKSRRTALVSPSAAGAPRWRTWELWRLPRATQFLVLGIVALAGVATLSAAWATAFGWADLLLFGVLLGAGAVSVETTRRVPEPAGMNANDMLGAWWLATAVLLPPVYALLAPVPLMALTQWRVRRIGVHKRVYTAAAIGLANAAASVAFHALPRPLTEWSLLAAHVVPLTVAVIAVGVLAKALNAVLIGLAVKTSDPEARWRQVFVVGNGQLEVTEVCTGVVMAMLAALGPILVAVGLPPMLLLQRGMMYAQLRAEARTDSRTGLLNAGTWEREVAEALAGLVRHRQAAAVLLVDIDHFKRVNDTYGHPAGDTVLREVAQLLSGLFRRDEDLVGRVGGEEFAILLPGMDAAQAGQAAERLRRAVAGLAVPVDDARLVQVTVSVGVAAAAAPGRSVTELLATADHALYQAKAAGRDQVWLPSYPDRRAHGA